MKQLLTATALLAVAGSAHAGDFDGAYAGLNIGHNSTDVKITEDWTPSSFELGASGMDYGLMDGYGQTVNGDIYLGAEMEANLSSADSKITYGADTLKLSKKNSYGVAVRAGYDMGSVLPYVRVGYNRAKFESELSGTYTGKGSDTLGGIALGAGMEAKVSDNVSLRGEFVHTAYGKSTDTDGTNTITAKPTENVARVGVAFRF